MRKINNKGFMMVEIIVVAVVVVIGLVGLFTTFTRTFLEYERYNEYSQVDSLYASRTIVNSVGNTFDDDIDNNGYIKIDVNFNKEVKEIFSQYKVKNFFILKFNNDNFEKLLLDDEVKDDEAFVKYLKYLINNLDFSDTDFDKISIIEMESNLYQNKSQYGYYKIGVVEEKKEEENNKCLYNLGYYDLFRNIYVDKVLPSTNYPDLTVGLFPVKYDNENNLVFADPSQEWYNYEKQQWANAVSLKDNSKSYCVGDKIDMDDVLAMFVWIPRFSYTIKCDDSNCFGVDGTSAASPGVIDINFVDVDKFDAENSNYNSDMPNNYRTPLSFVWKGKQLGGFWIGKFETSVNKESTCYQHLDNAKYSSPTFINGVCTNCSNICKNMLGVSQYIKIVPDVRPLTDQSISAQFLSSTSVCDNVSLYGLYDCDSHMIKNSEWAAVAYLSQSKYGKYGNDSFTIKEKQIYMNNSGSSGSWLLGYTGRSSGSASNITQQKNGSYSYSIKKYGTGASTTGNIYGVYDMNGGVYERVMANYKNTVRYADIKSSFFENFSDYYDKISSCPTIGMAYCDVRYWYNDSSEDLKDNFPWLLRGGYISDGTGSGIFSTISSNGLQYYNIGTRVVLVK